MKERILVTGASGQDGMVLIRKLLERNHEVIGYGRKRPTFQTELPGKFRFIDLTKENYFNPKSIISRNRITKVYHLAAISSPLQNELNQKDAWEVNYHWVSRLLDAAIECGAKFIFTSTGLIYPDSRECGVISEITKPHPKNLYGKIKYEAMQVIEHRRQEGAWAVNAILFNHEVFYKHGSSLFVEMITKLIRYIEQGDSISFYNAFDVRNWSNAEGIIDALISLSDVDIAEDYILGAPDSYSVLEVAQGILEKLGYEKVPIVSNLKVADNIAFVDCSKSYEKFGMYLKDSILDVGETAVKYRLGSL